MNYIKLFLPAVVLFLCNSCGVLLDSNRISGKWNLSSTEYYVYNSALNSNKTYIGKDCDKVVDKDENFLYFEPKEDYPMNSEFFSRCDNYSYVLEFQGRESFRIYFKDKEDDDGDGEEEEHIVAVNRADNGKYYPRGRYYLNTFDNTLSLYISSSPESRNQPDTNSFGLWKEGFEIKNSWPMPDYSTLEIIINAEDTGRSYFTIHLKNKIVKAQSMKAVFTKSSD